MDKFFKWTALFVVLVILASGGVAFYTVFLADRGMTMPSFRERPLIAAVADAEQLGLSVRIEQMESTLPTGNVLAQWPEPGARIRGHERNVILKVSRGGERRPIPDIRGIEQTIATRLLEEQGFTVGDIIRIRDSTNSGFPAGTVLAQSPASPGNVPVNIRVDLLVSEGSEDGSFAVPDVSQFTESAAREALERAGLRVAVDRQSSRNVIEGQVINTRPVAGAMVRRNTEIRISVSTGPAPTTAAIPTPTVTPTTPSRPNSEPNLTDLSILDQPRTPPTDVIQERTPGLQNDPHFPQLRPTPPDATPTPVTPAPATPTQSAPDTNVGTKVARIMYQVPPILRPLPLRIEIVDPQGRRLLMERDVRANERVQLEANYTQEAVVSIFLGGEFVWQDRFR